MDFNGNDSVDTNKNVPCESQDLRIKEQDTNTSSDATHGEWLVVSRSKRKTKSKGKGKVTGEDKHGNQNVVKKNYHFEKKENLSQTSKHPTEGPSFVFGKTNKASIQTKDEVPKMNIEGGKKSVAIAGDVNLQERLDKYLQVVLQPKHVVEERKLDPIDDSDAEMSGQDESSNKESEADEVAMAEEDNEVHDQ
ncbi:hypothetical protein SESBI_24997 [Sesbania bispinosa]|nr:hypothetical protein SESBI_24997 [Sesbania bispinosa]